MNANTAGSGRHLLSGYLTPPGPHSVLSRRHDQNLALWKVEGDRLDLVRVWELERLSGQKHHRWPVFSESRLRTLVTGLLAAEGLEWSDIECSWGTPGLPKWAPVRPPAGTDDLAVHSLAHLYSGLRLDSRVYAEGNVVAMALDSVPDFTVDPAATDNWYAGCVSRAGAAEYWPVESPAPLYTACSRLFGLEPGSLMALAEAASTRIEFDAARAVESLRLFGGFLQHGDVALPFVQALIADATRQLAGARTDPRFNAEENLQSAVMKAVQECCELIVDRDLERLIGGTRIDPGSSYLSITGGFALNCPTNTRLLNRYGFLGLLTPPCPNDSGQAIGLGLLGLDGAGLLDGLEVSLDSAYYGREDVGLDTALQDYNRWVVGVSPFDVARFVDDVIEGPVAWVHGAAEIGPRALGHRSLLGDPRYEHTKDRLNEMKGRQWWRPVAPIVLAEHAADWFAISRPSPFMLEAGQVREDVRDQVPAVVHLDGTARHQTLSEEADPVLHRAIDAFRRRTGVPVLCNTSLNDRGEPIADTASEAINFCIRKGVRVAYVADVRVELDVTAGRATPTGPHGREWAGFFADEAELMDSAWAAWRRAGFTDTSMLLLARHPELRDQPSQDVNELARRRSAVEPAFERIATASVEFFGPGARFSPTGPGS